MFQKCLMELCLECSATGMGQFPICKLKWDLLRTSVTACTLIKIHFLPHLESFMWERKKNFFKTSHIQTSNGVLLIFKLPFPNGSYRKGVCRALWAEMSQLYGEIVDLKLSHKCCWMINDATPILGENLCSTSVCLLDSPLVDLINFWESFLHCTMYTL